MATATLSGASAVWLPEGPGTPETEAIGTAARGFRLGGVSCEQACCGKLVGPKDFPEPRVKTGFLPICTRNYEI